MPAARATNCSLVRLALYTEAGRLSERFGIAPTRVLHHPRYNVSPGETVWAITLTDGARSVRAMRWGVAGSVTIDAEAMAVLAACAADRPATALHGSKSWQMAPGRCLIPADGFYTWRPPVCGGDGHRTPYYVTRQDEEPFAIAGLFGALEAVNHADAEADLRCAILTSEADDRCARLRDWMPVILDRRAEDAWLDPQPQSCTELADLLRMLSPPDEFLAYAVSADVNSPKRDGPELIREQHSDHHTAV